MKKLVIVCSSRARVANVKKLIGALKATKATCDLVIGADDDDKSNYESLEVRVSRGPQAGCVATINRVALEVVDNYEAICIIGDDQLPRTKNWDKTLLEVLDNKYKGTGIVYGDDLFQSEKHPTGVVISSNLVKALGFVAPPCLHHMYADDFWLNLGRSLGRIAYVPEVVIEHMHPVCGKAEMDESYELSGSFMDQDGKAWSKYISEQFTGDVRKCKVLL